MTAAYDPTLQPTIDVRQLAEQRVPKTLTNVSGMSAEEIGELLYELEVHQEELKVQAEELRRVQLDLESSRDSLADLYDFAPVGYLTVDANGLIVQANLATATMLGLERSKIVGTRLALYCDKGSEIELQDHLKKVLSSQTSQSCELKFTTPNGATIDVRLHSNHLAASGSDDDWQCRVIMTDISRDKATESKLRESESFFRTIFEQAGVGVAQLDSVSGVILKVNRRYCEMLKATPVDLVGKTWMELTHPDDLVADLGNMERLRAGEIREFSIEKRMERPDGSLVWINLTVSPNWQPGEDPSTHIAIVEDISDRKQAEESLRLSEARYRSLVTAAATTVWITNPQGGFSSVQPMWQAFTGQPWEEHRDYGWARMLHPDDAERMTSEWREVIAHPQPFVTAGRIYHAATGDYRHCEVHATPLLRPNGSVREWIGITIDVHDRRLAESERLRLQDILQRSLNELYVFDAESLRLGYVNAGAVRNLGYPLDVLYCMTPVDIKPEFTETTFRDLVAPLRSGKREILRFETLHQRADGSRYPVEVYLQLIRRENDEVFLSVVLDITERRNAEVALRESEEKFRALTERSPAIVLIARLEEILYCNSMLADVTGYSHEELLQMPLRDLIHPDFRESIADRQRRRLRGEDVPQRYDGKIVTKSGEERWLDVSVQLIEFEGAPAALVTCVDITKRKLAEAALRRSEETLREVNVSLEQRVAERTAELTGTNAELAAFAHTVSHDLRAPLRAMEGFATALAEDYGKQLDEDAREFIQNIIDSAERMDTLINDLLVLSRLGRAELRLKAIRLDTIFTEAKRQLSSEIEACHAKLDIADQLPTVRGHKATLVQVVVNLLSNAMKFVAEGVRPEIRAWTERQDNGMMRLWVEDNGIGIDDAYRDRIFRAFERLHGIESYPGTGIGLAIVARACERLGGRYGFESQPDRGSRFWVEFQEGDTNP